MLTSAPWRSARPGVRHRVFTHAGATWDGVWESGAGCFEFALESDTVVLVLAGCLIAQTGYGDTLTLDAGDVATLPAGLECVFTVPASCRCAVVSASDNGA